MSVDGNDEEWATPPRRRCALDYLDFYFVY